MVHKQFLSLFYERLLQNNIQLADWIDNSAAPIEESLERYRYLLSQSDPTHLEQQLLQAFQETEMKELGLPKAVLLRGLPRVYRKQEPAKSKIKYFFSSLPDLKRTAAAASIYSLYQHVALPKETSVAIATYVMKDGLGDYYAAVTAARVLKQAFPFLEIALFIVSSKNLPPGVEFEERRYEDSEEMIEQLRRYDLILQIPTLIPNSSLKERIETVVETVGEYGFIESDSFNPRSGAHCMGLHFLEVGLLLPAARSLNWSEAACTWLFKQKDPGPQEIEEYRSRCRFYLAYLYRSSGIYVYLHALLKSLESDAKDIDLCVPDAQKLRAYLAGRQKIGKTAIDNSYRVREMVFEMEGERIVQSISQEGKTVRIFCPADLSQEDVEQYLAFSEEFVGCRGDRSFSEIVFQEKGFFFDLRDHQVFLFRDLLFIAEQRIPMYRSTLQILHLYLKIRERTFRADKEWIDEDDLQADESINWLETAETIGICLQDPDAFIGFKKLLGILKEEYSCNNFLIHLLQRAVCHRHRAEIAGVEEVELKNFALGKQSFGQTVRNIREELLKKD